MLFRATFIAALAATTVLACRHSPPIRSGTESGIILALPQRIGPLYGHLDKPSAAETSLLPSDTEFAKRTYITATDDPTQRDIVRTTIVLAGSERRSIHRPEVCLPGQGWTIISGITRPIQIAPGKTLQVRDLTIERRSDTTAQARPIRAHYIYWFVGTDTTTPSHLQRTLLSTYDSIVRAINHRWAYVSLMASVTEGHSPAETGERPRTEEQTSNLIDYIITSAVPQFQKSFMGEGKE